MLSLIAFVVLGLVILAAAINCVSSRNVIHGAYWLLLAAVGTAGMTWFLGAEYIAITQMLIYAGAVGILTVFTVMVTQRSYESSTREVKLSWSALILALGFFALIAYGIISTPELAQFTTSADPIPLAEFGTYLFDVDGHALAFEIASLVLLVALVAAVWWTKDKDDSELASQVQQATQAQQKDAAPAVLDIEDARSDEQSESTLKPADGEEDDHATT